MNTPPSSSDRARRDGPRRRPRSSGPRVLPSNGPAPSHSAPVTAAPVTTAVRTVDLDTLDAPSVSTSFVELGVPAAIVTALGRTGVTDAFPIQAATLPDSLAKRDVLGRGKTGSGKTIAFAIPTVAALAASGTNRQPGRPRALVLVPTRELANQVTDVLGPLAAAMGQRVTTIIGGVGQSPQVAALRAGVDIVVACPGRLEDLIQQRHCSLDRVEVTVLDEADHMADLGFLPAVRRLMDATPSGGQRLLFSATLDNGVDVLVKRFMSNPAVHSVDPAIAPVSTMTHHVFAVLAADKPSVVHQLASGQERALLFMRTKHGAKKLAKQLTMAGIPAVELHGNLSQNARERNLESFTDGSTRVLVATDIAARGLHVDDIALVVHVDPPAEHKAYLHRSGRTARAGSEGVVVTIMTPDQVGDVKALARAAKIAPIITKVTPGHGAIADLVGDPAPFVKPAAPTPEPVRQPGGARPLTGRSGQATARPGQAARRSAPGQGAGRGSGPSGGRGSGRPAGRSGQGSGRSGGGHRG